MNNTCKSKRKSLLIGIVFALKTMRAYVTMNFLKLALFFVFVVCATGSIQAQALLTNKKWSLTNNNLQTQVVFHEDGRYEIIMGSISQINAWKKVHDMLIITFLPEYKNQQAISQEYLIKKLQADTLQVQRVGYPDIETFVASRD